MKTISPIYIISALRLFTLNRDKYIKLIDSLDLNKSNINEPIYVYSNGEIISGWETLKYVLDSNSLLNVYYQIVERETHEKDQ